MKNDLTITISMNRFEELLHKEVVFELKRQELQKAGFVSEVDKLLFSIPVKSDLSAKDDF